MSTEDRPCAGFKQPVPAVCLCGHAGLRLPETARGLRHMQTPIAFTLLTGSLERRMMAQQRRRVLGIACYTIVNVIPFFDTATGTIL